MTGPAAFDILPLVLAILAPLAMTALSVAAPRPRVRRAMPAMRREARAPRPWPQDVTET